MVLITVLALMISMVGEFRCLRRQFLLEIPHQRVCIRPLGTLAWVFCRPLRRYISRLNSSFSNNDGCQLRKVNILCLRHRNFLLRRRIASTILLRNLVGWQTINPSRRTEILLRWCLRAHTIRLLFKIHLLKSQWLRQAILSRAQASLPSNVGSNISFLRRAGLVNQRTLGMV